MKLVGIMVILAGCSTGASAVEQSEVALDGPRPSVTIPLSLYIVSDAADPDGPLSSQRTVDELETVAVAMGEIWAQADVVFAPVLIEEITVPADVLVTIASDLDASQFFAQVGLTFDVPSPGAINGFYVANAGGVNGFAPTGGRVFFVDDNPTVHDERVSSHEIGHILGLRHTRDDAGRLLFSGTNGMELDEQEQEVARYGAEGLLES